MTVYTERNNTTLLSSAADADGDPLSVTKINGQAALVGVAVPLSVGGSVTVSPDGVVLFDDTGFTIPEIGDYVADSLIATISDGVTEVDTSVNLELYGAIAGQALLFGALTRPFEGGAPAPAGATSITGGDPDGHFVISDGKILPAAASSGALSGEYSLTMDTGKAQIISIVEDTFSIANDAELFGLLNDDTQPYDDKTILLRAGQYGPHRIPPQTLSGLTLQGEPGARMDRLEVRPLTGQPDVTVRNITFQPPAPETQARSRVFLYKNPTPNGTITFENCQILGHPGTDPESDIWAAKLDYSGATGSFAVGEKLLGSNNGEIELPILEVFDNGDGTGTLWLSDDPGQGTGGSVFGNRLVSGLTLTGDTSGTTAVSTSDLYGGDPTTSFGLISVGTAFAEMYVRGCCFSRLDESLRVGGTRIIEVTDNVCDQGRSDFIKTVIFDDDRPSEHFHIKRNLHMRSFGKQSDYSNPHVDSVQFLFGHMTQDLPGLEITDNIFMLGGRAKKFQALFLTQGTGNGAIKDGLIANNIFDNGNAWQIRATRWRGGAIRDNLAPVLIEADDAERLFLVGEALADANTVYQRNVTEGIRYYTADGKVGGPVEDPSGNYLPGKNADWSQVYAGLTGSHATDVSDLLAQMTPMAGTPIMTGNSWVSGSDYGCVTEAGRFIGIDGSDITDVLLTLESKLTGQAEFQLTPGGIGSGQWSVARLSPTSLELELQAVPSLTDEIEVYLDDVLSSVETISAPGTYEVSIATAQAADVTLAPRNSFGRGPVSAALPIAAASGGGTLSVDDFAVDGWPYDARAVFGENTAKIPVSGQIDPAQEGLSIRARQAGTTGPGQIIGTTDAQGAFAGHMDALEDGLNHQLEVFLDGNASVSATTTNSYSTGNHVVIWSQSELAKAFNTPSSLTPPALTDGDNTWFVGLGAGDLAPSVGDTPFIVKAGDAGARVALKHMSNVYADVAPGRKFVVIDCMESGSSMFAMLDDTATNRDWEFSRFMIEDYIRGTLGDTPSFNFYCWWAADRAIWGSAQGPTRGIDVGAPAFFKETGSGSAVTFGQTYTLAPGLARRFDHSFYDNAAPTGERGAGLYALGETKFMFSHNAFGPSPTNPLENMADANFLAALEYTRTHIDDLIEDPRAIARGFSRGYDMTHFRIGNDFGQGWTDSTHPTINDRYGQSLVCEMIALNHLKAMGLVGAASPKITNAVWSTSDVTLSVDVGIGNRLTTYRDELGLGPVDAETHRAEVAGFEFQRGTVYDYPAAGDISITDDGSATGTATITITRNNEANDILRFKPGGAMGVLDVDDMQDSYNLNHPAVALAGISGPLVPVEASPTGAFLTAGGIGGQAPTQFVALNASRWTDTNTFPAGTNALTIDFKLKINEIPTGVRYLASMENAFELDQLALGRLRYKSYDGSSINLTTGNNVLLLDSEVDIRLIFDPQRGHHAVLMNGTVILEDNQATSGGTVTTIRNLHILGRFNGTMHLEGEMAYVRVYDSAEADYELPATLYKEVTSPAANANAAAGWVQTGGAVSDV